MEIHYKSQELLRDSIRTLDLKENDAVSIKTLKVILVNEVIIGLGLTWNTLINLFKTHTPIHPEIARELQEIGDEEITTSVAQIFVRNEKLVRMMKGLTQQGNGVDALLAVDGLGGAHAPNFEHKHYVGNLRFGGRDDTKSAFDNEPEYKRKHVQIVRELYKMLKDIPSPEKEIYQILRYSFNEVVKINLPEIEMEEKVIDIELQKECVQYYIQNMGKENIENLAKTVKRSRGEKRSLEKDDN